MSTVTTEASQGTDPMGEVRTTVRLTNPFDEMLHKMGQISAEEIRSTVEDALVDTGTVRTAIPRAVMETLGLSPRDRRSVEYADGRLEEIDVAGPVLVEINGQDTFDDALIVGDEVLIGQTVLEKLDLLVDCRNRKLIPNPKHPNGPVTRI